MSHEHDVSEPSLNIEGVNGSLNLNQSNVFLQGIAIEYKCSIL